MRPNSSKQIDYSEPTCSLTPLRWHNGVVRCCSFHKLMGEWFSLKKTKNKKHLWSVSELWLAFWSLIRFCAPQHAWPSACDIIQTDQLTADHYKFSRWGRGQGRGGGRRLWGAGTSKRESDEAALGWGRKASIKGVQRLYIAGMLINCRGSSENRSLLLPCDEMRHCSTGNLGQLRWKNNNRKLAKREERKMN